MDFLAEQNVAGQTLLRLVSRGNAIIAELLRLSQNIPPLFLEEIHPPATKPKAPSAFQKRGYPFILFDFSYLNRSELYEKRIESDPRLQELDQEFRDNHIEILKRFYMLFESVYRYVNDLLMYLEELEKGVFIQLTLEILLLNVDGKQLLSEAVYLYGIMLILLDEKIEGLVRERMLIAYLRYKGQTETPLLDEVCKLCQNTLYVPGQKKPANYPEAFFKRFPLPDVVTHMLLGRLRTDDIYNQVSAYPLPEHRSTALSTQAAMLYVVLYFSPDVLNGEQATMREIVDKFFPDNWIISIYLGVTVDLSIAWSQYPAARSALLNSLQLPSIQNLTTKHLKLMETNLKDLGQILTEGVFTLDYILESSAKLMAVARNLNVNIRWLILHCTSNVKKIKDIILKDLDNITLLTLIMKTAQFEFELKQKYKELLDTKEDRWNTCKKEGSERMKELSEFFSGEKALTRIKKNESLCQWFSGIGDKINQLDFYDSTAAGRKIQQLMQALEEVEQFHEIETNLQIKQFLEDTRQYLNQMIRIVNIKEQFLGVLSLVSDMSYGWEKIQDFIPLMQEKIKVDPRCVLMLRSTFLKLSSIMELPLVRINQAQSRDIYSVSKFYSTELVGYVRKVLSIIPRSMFMILNEIIDIQTNKLQEFPTKVEKEKISEYIQLDNRYFLARATHAISVFTEGILAMEKTLVGVIEVDPKKLLEDGIRKELVQQISNAIDKAIVFPTASVPDFFKRLNLLAAQLDGFRRSFQYIQDYVNIYGLKIWQEEFSRIVNYNVEQECNSFLKTKVYDWQSQYQSEAIPIPVFPSPDPECHNFIGRLAKQILLNTDFVTTTYIDQMSGWYTEKGIEVTGIRTFSLLMNAVGVFGITGLDRLISFKLVKEIQDLISTCRLMLQKGLLPILHKLRGELLPTSTIPASSEKTYQTVLGKVSKGLSSIITALCRIGQMQLIRRHIAALLNFSSRIDSKQLFHSLEALNIGLLNDVQAHYLNPEIAPYPEEDLVLSELASFLEFSGISDPFTKIYVSTTPIDQFPLMMFLFVLTISSSLQYNKQLSILQSTIPRKKGGFDVTPLVVGLITFLKQFHSIHTQTMLAYLGQYIRTYVNTSVGPKAAKQPTEIPAEAHNVLLFLEAFTKLNTHFDRKNLDSYLPPYILDSFNHNPTP